MTAPTFILSLDCEGRWGIADRPAAATAQFLDDEPLKRAYQGTLALLDELRISATFAFVGLFAESKAGFDRIRPGLDALAAAGSDYLAAALKRTDEGREGWHGAWAVDAVGSAKTSHEIALHGITHQPWGEIDRELAEAELALHSELSSPARKARTFIAPRNQVGHVDLLKSIGIEGYREAPPRRPRAVSLLSEFNLLQRAQRYPRRRDDGLVAIPSGFFVNTAGGPRRLVPPALTKLRARRMLDSAADGEVVHFWLHPENIAAAPGTLDTLRAILTLVADRRERGRCEVLTQLDYVVRMQLDAATSESCARGAELGLA